MPKKKLKTRVVHEEVPSLSSESSGSEEEENSSDDSSDEPPQHMSAAAQRLLDEDGASDSSESEVSDGEEASELHVEATAAAATTTKHKMRAGKAEKKVRDARNNAAITAAKTGSSVVAELVAQRDAARARKDWATADRLRDEIEKTHGLCLQDTAGVLGSGASDIVAKRTNYRSDKAKEARKFSKQRKQRQKQRQKQAGKRKRGR